MTFKLVAAEQTASLVQIYRANTQVIDRVKLRIQPLVKLTIAFLCLTLGLRLLNDNTPFLVSLVGISLLMRAPAYLYFAWRDYCEFKEARVALMMGWYLKGYRGCRVNVGHVSVDQPVEGSLLALAGN